MSQYDIIYLTDSDGFIDVTHPNEPDWPGEQTS